MVFSVLPSMCAYAQNHEKQSSRRKNKEKKVYADLERDSIRLAHVIVLGKSKIKQQEEGAYAVTAIDLKNVATSVTNLSDFLSRASGLNIRSEGGLGSDYQLSVNGMSGNSIRYFVDGVLMSQMGSGVDLSNYPINTIDRIEVYKGVVPAYLGADALGGAINIITKEQKFNYLDASVSAGSFHTLRTDACGQVRLGRSGLLLRPQLSYNYSKNDYRMHGVEVWNKETLVYDTVSRKRFHDNYKSVQGQVDIGVKNKTWTDAFFAGIGYTDTKKELQTGQVQTIVVGQAEHNTSTWNIHANYRKRHFILPRLCTTISLSHTWDHSVTADTTFRRYDWNGNYKKTSRNELNGRGRILRHYERPLTIGRANFSYAFASSHSLTLNYMLTRTGNKRKDKAHEFFPEGEVQDLPSSTNDVLERHIIGLSYDQTLFGERMLTSFFAKDYINHVDVEQKDLSNITNSLKSPSHAVENFWGYGLGSRFTLNEGLSLKFCYEHTVRLPQARELLGNGTTIYANFALRPETSHNINLGAFGTARISDEQLIHYDAMVFTRITKDYIRLRISEGDGTAQYENVNDVTTKGVEAEVRYNYSDWLQLTANGSVQESLDMKRKLDNGNTNATYKNRIPNRPWMFANTELLLTSKRLFVENDQMRFNLLYQYVHWYYLTWEAYGNVASKARIPSQNVLNASLTYSWKNERYNMTLSCNNITNRVCYDNYKLQKPGRNMMCKFTLRLH